MECNKWRDGTPIAQMPGDPHVVFHIYHVELGPKFPIDHVFFYVGWKRQAKCPCICKKKWSLWNCAVTTALKLGRKLRKEMTVTDVGKYQQVISDYDQALA